MRSARERQIGFARCSRLTVVGVGVIAALLVPLGGRGAPPAPVVPAFERFHAIEPSDARLIDGGLLLLNELNCVACHAAPAGWRERLPGRGRILLTGVGSRLDATLRDRFIREPLEVKPGTTMPALLSGDGPAADAIGAYLASLTSTAPHFPAGDAARGRRLYDSIGCAACHAPTAGVSSLPSVPIALATGYHPDALAAFLRDPLLTRPAGRMPAFDLTEREAADLAAFLGATATPAAAAASVRQELVAEGRIQFSRRGCAACHDDGGGAQSPIASPLAAMHVDRGCLASAPADNAPWFGLSAAQVAALARAVREIQSAAPLVARTPEQQVTASMEQLNCHACHEWRGKGGADAVRSKFFTATESAAESLGELGRVPPKLDAAGRKLTPEWLEKLLWGSGGGVRGYMTVRMPRFGRAAAAELVPLLAAACRPATPLAIDVSGAKGHQRFATGRALIGAGEGGLGCVACHGLNQRNPSGIRSINLTQTAKRLRPEYFKALLLDPQGIQPGTIMPPLFAGRKSADKEIESIWTYLKELDQNPRLPEGLVETGSYELKPAAEGKPIVFRTFLVGAGTQAIAVGYPAGVHAAFDSLEGHWAVVWRGRFLDAMSNWEERTMPPVKPLGEAPRLLPPRLPLARLAAATDPWPTACGPGAGFVFRGYRLDSSGAPTFRYRIAGFEIEDLVLPDANGRTLRRRVIIRGPDGEGRWFFRGLSDDAPPQPVVLLDGRAVFEETISF